MAANLKVTRIQKKANTLSLELNIIKGELL